MRIDTLTTYIYKDKGEQPVVNASANVGAPKALSPAEMNLNQESESTTAHILSFLEEKKKRRKRIQNKLVDKYQAQNATSTGTKGLIVNLKG